MKATNQQYITAFKINMLLIYYAYDVRISPSYGHIYAFYVKSQSAERASDIHINSIYI